jgi:3-phosphoshikimate 1-carboxyvinyltransferase
MPGDKSISHRAAMLGALANGNTTVEGFASSADCASTIECLRAMGASITVDGSTVRIKGLGTNGLQPPNAELDCGNSGSTMRMLSGVLAGQSFGTTLTGDDSLSSRPMGRIIDPLTKMGAQISSLNGRAPLKITGRSPLTPISYETPMASAQVKSCVLLGGLFADGRTEVIEKLGLTRDHTERMLRWLGVDVQSTLRETDGAPVVAINGPAQLSARDISVPGDVSSAAFFIVGAAFLPGSDLLIENIGLNPTRAQVISAVRSLGVDIRIEDEREVCNEPVGNIRVLGSSSLAPTEGPAILQGPVIAQLIDELPVLSVLGTQVEDGLIIRNAAELRVKESDRISTTVANLRAMGAEVEEFKDGLQVHGPVKLRGAKLDAHGDHRIAMAFSIAALIADGPSEISGAECVAVSFPEFYELLDRVTQR